MEKKIPCGHYSKMRESPTPKPKADMEAKAQAVLDARAAHPEACLADLYDPDPSPRT